MQGSGSVYHCIAVSLFSSGRLSDYEILKEILLFQTHIHSVAFRGDWVRLILSDIMFPDHG